MVDMETSPHFHSLALATTLFILCQISSSITHCAADPPTSGQPASTTYIKQSCSITTYPQLCYDSLATYADEIQSDPKSLATKSLSVALSAAKSASPMMRRLSRAPGLAPREAGAMADCVTVVADTVYELQKSVQEMDRDTRNGMNFEMQMSNVQTWVSAALTDENTCMDGFAGSKTDGKIKRIVRGQILRVAHLTSNALALVNNYATASKARRHIHP
ncbi:hypothetical protein Ancab_032504 [Ancistrocladus abbreviatus]